MQNSLEVVCIGISAVVLAYFASVTMSLDTYMDEIFHIPQAQLFCNKICKQSAQHQMNPPNIFKYISNLDEWNDKITTPPGLYLISVLINNSLGCGCSVEMLRIANIVGASITPILVFLCSKQVRRAQ